MFNIRIPITTNNKIHGKRTSNQEIPTLLRRARHQKQTGEPFSPRTIAPLAYRRDPRLETPLGYTYSLHTSTP